MELTSPYLHTNVMYQAKHATAHGLTSSKTTSSQDQTHQINKQNGKTICDWSHK